MKRQQTKNINGFTLVEVMIGMVIIGFVIVTILQGFAAAKVLTQKNTEKNLAIMLADMRLQELTQYTSQQLETFASSRSTPGLCIDFVVRRKQQLYFYSSDTAPGGLVSDPRDSQQFRRVTTIETDMLGQTATIRVMVEYGRSNQSGANYPFRVFLSTRRTLNTAM